ncbi:MAG TPA: phosphoenolpyruvate carboxylase, partial [Gaiellaceae bacterium]|nr:phosphoenolpyruvate carboxylase [Gaiellaceae bacterium]
MTTSADAPLRRDVRLLGETLGRVLVEQEGEELLRAEERIRLLSREARRGGDPALRAELAEAVRALSLPDQATVLRAFGLYFQLANIAEQHHRVRRRRQYERENRVPRESLAEAFALLERAGVADADVEAALRTISLELVLTAHPTEATRRTVLAAHLRVSGLLDELDGGADIAARAAEEVTALWQTDEVRPRRPRVVDEIRHGLWFFEQSLFEAAERLLAGLRGRAPGAPAPFRFGSWI